MYHMLNFSKPKQYTRFKQKQTHLNYYFFVTNLYEAKKHMAKFYQK